MKRIELKRKKPLPRGEGPKRRAWMSSGGKAIERAATRRQERPRYTGPSRTTKELMAIRSGGMCELGIVCLGKAPAQDPSHRVAKGMGGTYDPRSNRPSNNAAACRPCHDIVERDPEAAYRNGWKIRHGVARPSEMPFRHWEFGWVVLDDEGGYRPAPRASWDRPVGLLPVVAATDASEPGYVDLSYKTLKRFGHDRCRGWEWDEQNVVSCTCGAVDLFVAEVTS